MRSLTVSDWSNIQSMMLSYLIWPKIQGKITGPGNIGHSDLKHYEVTDSVRLIKYPKYDAFLFHRAEDTGQNHWTRKYRSQ